LFILYLSIIRKEIKKGVLPMQKLFSALLCLPVLFACSSALSAQKVRESSKAVKKIHFQHGSAHSVKLLNLLDSAVEKTLEEFKDKGLKADEIAATLIDMRITDTQPMVSVRGEAQIYPASVVKMFYMSALHRQIEDGKIRLTPEMERGLKNMIIDSGNESTGYILDVLTGTTSGPEIPEKKFKKWAYKRNAINRYFKSLGYENISINQKTHCEDAWGREQQFRGYGNKNRNTLTTNATAKLLSEIVRGKSVTPERSKQMMELMKRDWEKPAKDAFHQEFISWALKPGTKLWSKEGWTSKTRHDAAYIETPEGLKFILVVFTENHATEQEIIPSVARKVIKGLGEIK